ncbi:YggW family oxidoreductase [Halothiobacillus diazotrophicus]|uniref:Heme chaperone HemW n=1 Tax=Halothiobacillus diazotrophicus TaxID=1860122 RepID=A0A191ZHW0_9GAMM|nr:radical SAM family heme chaperone HemW [Halothiobacillus diazotrophicus]ANJ67442.1 YggW family oxidoreductase [Halothiobacillus diazotrophicus]
MQLLQFTENPPLALYIHLPWCMEKCPYCDFNSHGLKGQALPERDYIDALLRDIERELPLIWGRPIETIFIGGGTPSLFSPEGLDRLFSGLRALLDLRFCREVTLEVNPGTDMATRLSEYRSIGINRVSIGVQSFDDDSLRRLGRIHDHHAAIRTIEAAHDAGLDSFNIDLMFGLPHQSTEQAEDDIRQALDLEPPHLSWYQLTLEPNTPFAAHPPTLPEDDTMDAINERGLDRLVGAGFQQYEVSAYAQPGHACQHNLNYWQFGDYLGIGAGAHGKITLAGESRIERRVRTRHPSAYLAQAGSDAAITAHTVPSRELPFEFMLNALRLTEGFDVPLFTHRTGLPIKVISDTLHSLEQDELITWTMTHIRPTERGARYLNDLVLRFMPD